MKCGPPSWHPQDTRELKSVTHYFYLLFSFDHETVQGLYQGGGSEYYKHCLGLERGIQNLGSATVCKPLTSPSFFDCRIVLDRSQADLPILHCEPVLLLMQPKTEKGPVITLHPFTVDEC